VKKHRFPEIPCLCAAAATLANRSLNSSADVFLLHGTTGRHHVSLSRAAEYAHTTHGSPQTGARQRTWVLSIFLHRYIQKLCSFRVHLKSYLLLSHNAKIQQMPPA